MPRGIRTGLAPMTPAEKSRAFRARQEEQLRAQKSAFYQLEEVRAALYTASQSGRVPAHVMNTAYGADVINNLIDFLSGQDPLFEVEKTKRRAPKKGAAK